jgi:protein TonB
LLKERIGGKVYLGFVIETNGRLTDIKAICSPDDRLSQEAIRVVQQVKYRDGTQNGNPVRVSYIMGINFDIDNPDKHSYIT